MTKAQMHDLKCMDQECEIFSCVARRDYEAKIARLTRELSLARIRFNYLMITSDCIGVNKRHVDGNCAHCLAQYGSEEVTKVLGQV